MEAVEGISAMYTRFTKIVNASRALGKNFSNRDLVRKNLRSLPPKFNPKVTKIFESHDLRTLEIENLIGNLKTYELELKVQQNEYNKEPRKKTLALKSKKDAEEEEEESLMVKNLTRFMKNPERSNSLRKYFQKDAKKKDYYVKKEKESDEEEEKQAPEFYHCPKTGHIRSEFPKYLKERKERQHKGNGSKKVLKASTCDESSSEESSGPSSSDEDDTNLCLMGKEDEPSEDDKLSDYEICRKAKKRKDIWYLNSGCFKHMSGNKNKFLSLEKKTEGTVTFRDNRKGQIVGIGTVEKLDIGMEEEPLQSMEQEKEEPLEEHDEPEHEVYEPPSMLKFTKDHSKELVIGESSTGF